MDHIFPGPDDRAAIHADAIHACTDDLHEYLNDDDHRDRCDPFNRAYRDAFAQRYFASIR